MKLQQIYGCLPSRLCNSVAIPQRAISFFFIFEEHFNILNWIEAERATFQIEF